MYTIPYSRSVKAINGFEGRVKKATDEEIRGFKYKVNKTALHACFAVAKEAIRRELGITLYDEQLSCGLVLNKGRIAQMGTGEGKTYSVVAPAYVHVLLGEKVHVVTANPYLARRDSDELKGVYGRLYLCHAGYGKLNLIVQLSRRYYGELIDLLYKFWLPQPKERLIRECKHPAEEDRIDICAMRQAVNYQNQIAAVLCGRSISNYSVVRTCSEVLHRRLYDCKAIKVYRTIY